MTEGISTTNQQLLVAIDIAKFKHNVLIEYPNSTKKSFIIQNTLNDFKRLEDMLKRSNMNPIVGFEATADYHRPIAYYLLNAGFKCHLVSSIATARTRDAMYNAWDKNDPKDAQVILHLLKTGTVQTYHDPLIHEYNDIQELSNTYHQISKRKTRLQHSLINHYLTLYFPEAERYYHSSRALWFTSLLSSFPTPSSIIKYSLDEFVEAAWGVSGRKVNKKNWLLDFYQTAHQSIALPVAENSQAIAMFRIILDEHQYLCRLMRSLEDTAENFLSANPDYQILKSIPGILAFSVEISNAGEF